MLTGLLYIVLPTCYRQKHRQYMCIYSQDVFLGIGSHRAQNKEHNLLLYCSITVLKSTLCKQNNL